MTLYQLADDIAAALGYHHDDAVRNRNAISYNVKLAIDRVRRKELAEGLTLGHSSLDNSDSLFTTTVTPAFATADPADPRLNFDHHYFNLPRELYDLPHDGGLAMVRYNRNGLPRNCPPQIARAVFTHTTLGELSALYDMAYRQPCADRPYVARDQDRVYLFGVQPQVSSLLVVLRASIPDFADPDSDPNEDVRMPPEQLFLVKKMCIEAERFIFQIPQQRRKNDGRDLEPDQTVRTERQISVNDPNQ